MLHPWGLVASFGAPGFDPLSEYSMFTSRVIRTRSYIRWWSFWEYLGSMVQYIPHTA